MWSPASATKPKGTPPTADFLVQKDHGSDLGSNCYRFVPQCTAGSAPLSASHEHSVWQFTAPLGLDIYVKKRQGVVVFSLDEPGEWKVSLLIADKAGRIGKREMIVDVEVVELSKSHSRGNSESSNDVRPVSVAASRAAKVPKLNPRDSPNTHVERCGVCIHCVQEEGCGKCGYCMGKHSAGGPNGGNCWERPCLNMHRSSAEYTSSVRESSLSTLSSDDSISDVALSVPPAAGSPDKKSNLSHRCGSCENCLRLKRNDVCCLCCKCRRKLQGLHSIGACLRRPCLNLVNRDKAVNQTASAKACAATNKTIPESPDVEVGEKVYARWSNDELYYWGIVTKKFCVHSSVLFNVNFDDGDTRHRVPRRELLSIDEFIDHFDEDYFKKTAGMDLQTYHDNWQSLKAGDSERMDLSDCSTKEKKKVYNHLLSAKFIQRHWMDHSFKHRVVRGTVKSCWSNGDAEVEYWSSDVDALRLAFPAWEVLAQDTLQIPYALGYKEVYEEENLDIHIQDSTAWRWLVPDSVKDFPTFPPKRLLTFNGVSIELEARGSEIPGAGLGVFMRVTPVDTAAKRFVLKEHEVLDLGIYSPFRKEDVKHESVLLIKTFIFDGKPEEWVFDRHDKQTPSDDQHYGYDITDDTSGELHDLAKRNVLVYVNETDGVEDRTIYAERDPLLHIHYLLGKSGSMFALDFHQWIELKIDYGTSYERIRVQKGYSRLSEESEEWKKLKQLSEDHTTLDDIETMEASEAMDALDYIVGLDLDLVRCEYFWRCLLASLCVCTFLLAKKDEIDGARLTSILARTQGFLTKLVYLVSDEDISMAFYIGDTNYAAHVQAFLGKFTLEEIRRMPIAELRSQILGRLNVC